MKQFIYIILTGLSGVLFVHGLLFYVSKVVGTLVNKNHFTWSPLLSIIWFMPLFIMLALWLWK